MAQYPSSVRAGSGPTTLFERRPELYSVRHAPGDDQPDAIAVMRDDATGTFAVHEGQPGRNHPANDVGPVYSAGPDGPLAVPTGRIFVRLTAGVEPEQRRPQFDAAGFDIHRTLSYASNAVWLRPKAGGVAEALLRLDALARVPDVVHIEPQLLMQRARR